MKHLWLDYETTGLDAERCVPIEGAAILTTGPEDGFEVLDQLSGFIDQPDGVYWESGALAMHAQSGLLARWIQRSKGEFQRRLVEHAPSCEPLVLSGRNPQFDRQWFDDDRLHYRMFDVTTLYMLHPDLKPTDTAHRALDDITADLNAAQRYLEEYA